ncbi:beta-ketoacyl-[acyl-carrier-protein] synthase family protein [Candidatus Uhrbacteria bacterium]|nr:beta-ketoacyl-[acyl-carrier-protein] synthase family protein [Candidatus Uhrbacteria bacterium]
MGVLSPNANSVKEFSDAIFSGKSGIGLITRFDPSGLKIKIAAEVKNFKPDEYMPIAVVRKTDRFAQFGLATAKMAIADARLSAETNGLSEAAVVIGSGLGGQNFHEEMIHAFIAAGASGVAASSVPRITPNAVSAYIAIQNKIKGSNQVISTACSSSAQAIGEAFHKIRNKVVDLAVTGGVEAAVSIVNVAFYQAMMVLGTSVTGNIEDASRPFDATRNGFVIGEGAACLILEELHHALERNAPIHAEIVGFGSNCGAYHMVAPDPTGEDAKEAMSAALQDASLRPEDVDYISTHGTSTKLNDVVETRAIKALLGERAHHVPASSIKSMIGHTIGASGAIQAVASCLVLENDCMPPTIHLNNPDPECDLDYVPNKSRNVPVSVVLSNSFGFGSNNAVLVFKRFSNKQ